MGPTELKSHMRALAENLNRTSLLLNGLYTESARFEVDREGHVDESIRIFIELEDGSEFVLSGRGL